MPANFNNFELIQKYVPQAVDKYFVANAKTAILEQGSKFIDVNFKEAGYVKIASFLMDGLSNYYSANSLESGENPAYANYSGNVGEDYRDGFKMGNVSVEWEIFKLRYKRGKEFKIDYIEDEETASIVIGNLVEEFNRVKVIPEVDETRFSTIVEKCSVSLGNLVTENISANEIISKFNTAFEYLTENEVQEEEQIIFVNPTVMTLIRNTTELAKFLTQSDYKNGNGIDFTVEKYGGRPIIEVPSSRFFSKVLITDNGYRAQSGSKVINYMVISAKAVVPIRKIEWSKLYGPEQAGVVGFYGYIYNYLLYHDLIVPKNKVLGCYVSLSNTDGTAKASTLRVATRPGTVTNHWYLEAFYTAPAGMRGYVVYKGTAFTLGGQISSVGTEGEDYFVAGIGVDQDASTDTKKYFALVDGSGLIIAVSGEVTLEKK